MLFITMHLQEKDPKVVHLWFASVQNVEPKWNSLIQWIQFGSTFCTEENRKVNHFGILLLTHLIGAIA